MKYMNKHIQFLGLKNPLEKGMATHLVFLPAESQGQRSLWVTVHGVAKS